MDTSVGALPTENLLDLLCESHPTAARRAGIRRELSKRGVSESQIAEYIAEVEAL